MDKFVIRQVPDDSFVESGSFEDVMLKYLDELQIKINALSQKVKEVDLEIGLEKIRSTKTSSDAAIKVKQIDSNIDYTRTELKKSLAETLKASEQVIDKTKEIIGGVGALLKKRIDELEEIFKKRIDEFEASMILSAKPKNYEFTVKRDNQGKISKIIAKG